VNRILYLSRAEVEHLLDVDALLDALAGSLAAFSAGTTSVPPRVGARVPDRGVLGSMVGYVPGFGLEAKLVSVFPHNDQRGRPSHQALIALFDEEDGTPLALMDGTYITAIRTVERRPSRRASSRERTPRCWPSSVRACRAVRTSIRFHACATLLRYA
jgi:ornithine cyclodeaminase/alanine dehydrogenase-like protein (mu-crystallin family)